MRTTYRIETDRSWLTYKQESSWHQCELRQTDACHVLHFIFIGDTGWVSPDPRTCLAAWSISRLCLLRVCLLTSSLCDVSRKTAQYLAKWRRASKHAYPKELGHFGHENATRAKFARNKAVKYYLSATKSVLGGGWWWKLCWDFIFWPAPIISLWENRLFAYYFWTSCDRRLKMVPICLPRHSNSNSIQHDLLWPDMTSDLKSNFDLDLWHSICVWFYASWLEEHNDGKIVALGLKIQQLLQKNFKTFVLNIDGWPR